ncbi:MAG: radical SAM protein [Candidatus Omnitrophota bacterium]|jgi:wyosine [tRNA(Phe)-imidazoG37] synthetase (radical SAM superfamily)
MPQLVVADDKNRIYSIPHLEAVGMSASHFFRLSPDDLIKLPPGSQIFTLPDRLPIGYDTVTGKFITPDGDGPSHGKRVFAAAAFISPGYTATYSAAYKESGRPKMLPLFSYAAVAFYRGSFYVSAIKIDNEPRHDPRFIDLALVKKNVPKFIKIFPKNRLVKHLSECALTHGCPGAQNFFLKRCEGPLPSSPSCNARCAGCISFQEEGNCPATQPRIKFSPTPEEIAEVALYHIGNVKDTVVSFGQGCDGEPLLAGELLERSIKLIRSSTQKGIINVNTNASRPDTIARLFNAGLNSIRVSMNSAREPFYTRYYRPKGYTFENVLDSISVAKREGGFVSINYLTMPGFSDSKKEAAAFARLIETYHIDMIQWRNMNFDPMRYFSKFGERVTLKELLGVKQTIMALKERFPGLMMGYYNPARGRMGR